MKLLPQSLQGRTAFTVAISLFALLTLSLGSAMYFIAIPMAKRSADDFAAIIVSSAHTMQSLPADLQREYRNQLLIDHGLIVADQLPALEEETFDVPYFAFFRNALAQRTGLDFRLVESNGGPIVWVDVPVADRLVRMGFDRRRLGTSPLSALLLAIAAGTLLTWMVTVLEVRRVRSPLQRLSEAVRQVGRGDIPKTLPEDGPAEIASLAQAFNKMSRDLQALSENRTVVVAGISHDLRTPLTRMGIAVEMLDSGARPELVAAIRRDIEVMNELIAQFLDFSRGLEPGRAVEIDLSALIDDKASDLRRESVEVHITGCSSPCNYVADPLALGRLLNNLLDNAARHSGGKPIDVELQCSDRAIVVRVCDRGPGIPADQLDAVFQPFFRLEAARSNKSGGSGLGLAIARQLALKHGWTVELLARDGGGTVARVELPVVTDR